MLSQAQRDAIQAIRNAAGFVQDCNDPEANTANRSKPTAVAYMFIGAEGFRSVRIGVGGKLLAAKVSG